jgi:peptidase M28-like protein/PDZ domain-containing protein
MRIAPVVAAGLLGFALPLAAQTASTSRARKVADDVRYLASDALQGRKTCSAGNDSAADYIARELHRLHLTPAGDSGTWFQHWTAGNTSGTRQAGIAGCAARNVVAVIPGRGALASQYVMMGAHYDHLGLGPFGSASGDSGVIHNGADDNASGTAAVLDLARSLAALQSNRDNRPRRAIVVAWWSGEEEGDLGSAYFANHMPFAAESVTAYLNFDMVGRLHDGRVSALGVRTAPEWPGLLDSANAAVHLDVRGSGDGWGASDHASFTPKHIPVLHFFTDLHSDYHRPSDDADKINADGIVQVSDLGAELARRLAYRDAKLTWVDLPPPAPRAGSDRPRPSLGTIPDMTDEPGGVRLSGVRAGSPADSAGMREGDVLIGIGDATIANLEDFQSALLAHAAGDRVEIRYRRGDQVIRVMVTLAARAM